MRIVHVIGSLDPTAGGPPMVVGRLAAAQAQLGVAVRIVAYDCPQQEQAIATCRKTIPDFDRITLANIPMPDSAERYSGKLAFNKVTEQLHDSENVVVHVHGVWEPILRQATLAARAADVPYIIAPHGMLHPWSLSQSRWKKKLALMLGYRKMLKGAAAIHALNSDEALHIKSLGLHQTCHTIPNGVFLNEITPLPAPGSFITHMPELGGKPYILFLSRMHYKKGLDRLTDAFAMLAAKVEQLQLVIAGPDDGEQLRLRERIARHGLTSRVHLVGPLWDKSKYAAMQDAACFCLPSRQEGFSVAITEALAVGVPVVISEACCFNEVADAGAGYVIKLDDAKPQESINALAETLQRVLESQPNTAMRKAGRELVKTRYTWPAIAKQSLNAYEQMIGGRHV
jgi:glycosyltransferase involved in cell wall biosynthesis